MQHSGGGFWSVFWSYMEVQQRMTDIPHGVHPGNYLGPPIRASAHGSPSHLQANEHSLARSDPVNTKAGHRIVSTLSTWKLCIHVGKGAATVNGELERARHNDEAWIFDETAAIRALVNAFSFRVLCGRTY
jgi:hypothetical protein